MTSTRAARQWCCSRLRTVGHEVRAVCPERAEAETVNRRGHDFVLNATTAEVDPGEYDALVVLGGLAPEYPDTRVGHRDGPAALRGGQLVAALCHGPQILAATGVLDGYEMTVYPAVRAEGDAAGCSRVDGVVGDGHLITGQAWPDHPEWLAAFTDLLDDEVSRGDPAPASGD